MKSEQVDRADAFLDLIRRAERGKLKVYLGYCAGVGKTYEMLQEAHRLKADRIDVVVGYVETHGRIETAALLNGLEVMPRRKTSYRGIELEEMDLEAILQRRPSVVLVDELAHTNVPGSKNSKRYQDVQEIVHAGIHVISTLNVQHLESLYDTVERAVGVKVRERIPDSVLADADQLVNVDLTMEDLRKRLEEGKVYPRERIATALGNFFTSQNLEQLRELTLRELAFQIDLRRRESVEEEIPSTPDQVMACLSSRSPNSQVILRYASRLAGRLSRNWYAVYVQTPSEKPDVIDAETQRLLSNTLTLAKQLGAIVFTYKGSDIVDTILQFAHEYRVGHIVIGSPGSPARWWRRLLGHRTVPERLIADAKGFTVVVLDTRSTVALPPVVSPAQIDVLVEPQSPAPHQSQVKGVTLPEMLTEETILIWREPVTRDVAIKQLVEAACRKMAVADSSAVLNAVLDREKQGSTFFNEGVAFPHARLNTISAPTVALGLTQGGISDVDTAKPVDLIALILSPQSQPDAQVQMLARVSKAAQNRQLVSSLRTAASPREALGLLAS